MVSVKWVALTVCGRPVEAERTVLWNSLPVVDSQQWRSRVDSQQWRSSSRPSDAALPGSAAACTSCAACKLASASLTYLRRLLFLLSAVEIGGCSFVRLTSGLFWESMKTDQWLEEGRREEKYLWGFLLSSSHLLCAARARKLNLRRHCSVS